MNPTIADNLVKIGLSNADNSPINFGTLVPSAAQQQVAARAIFFDINATPRVFYVINATLTGFDAWGASGGISALSQASDYNSALAAPLAALTATANAAQVAVPTVYPNRALAEVTYPPASNKGRSIVVGGTLAETRVSNGKGYITTVPGPSATKRAVATNCSFPNNFAAANKQLLCTRNHIVRSRITQIGARLVNKYRDPTTWTELSPGAATTYNVGLVVNGVNIGSLKLAGNASMVVADGATADTDYLACDLYPGDVVKEIFFLQNANGILYEGAAANGGTRPNYQDATNGEICYIAASGLTDQTTGTTITGGSNYPSAMGGVFALFGVSSDPAIYIIGDSEEVGIGEAYTGTIGTRGAYARSIAPYFAFSKYAEGGDGAVKFVASHAVGVAMQDLFTHVVCGYGVNDITNFARTAAQTLTDMSTIAGYFTGKPFYVRTLSPDSTSTDNWLTTANQTPVASAASLNTYNNSLRAVPAWATACFEFSDAVSTARDSNIWQADGVTVRLNTPDGLHFSAAGSQLAVNAGAFRLNTITAY